VRRAGGQADLYRATVEERGQSGRHDMLPTVALINENCARLGVTCVRPVLAADFSAEQTGPFDRILLDRPVRHRSDAPGAWFCGGDHTGGDARLRAVQLDLMKRAALC